MGCIIFSFSVAQFTVSGETNHFIHTPTVKLSFSGVQQTRHMSFSRYLEPNVFGLLAYHRDILCKPPNNIRHPNSTSRTCPKRVNINELNIFHIRALKEYLNLCNKTKKMHVIKYILYLRICWFFT